MMQTNKKSRQRFPLGKNRAPVPRKRGDGGKSGCKVSMGHTKPIAKQGWEDQSLGPHVLATFKVGRVRAMSKFTIQRRMPQPGKP